MIVVPFLLANVLVPRPVSSLPSQVKPLVEVLQNKGFTVKVALPPIQGVYGLYRPETKTLWISPVTIPLGIARQTLLHEAVHAVQSCPSGMLTPIGWDVKVSPVVEREISAILLRSYGHANRVLEKEAFFMQGHVHAESRLMAELNKRCL